MKLRKKALIPAIAMVLASVIALSGVTYAWFTLSEEATVGELDVNVAVADGIQVSLDAYTWKNVITADDIKAAAGGSLENTYSDGIVCYPLDNNMLPTSSAGNVTGALMDIFDGGYAADQGLYSQKISESRTTGGNIVAFDLFIQSSSPQKIKLVFGDSGKATYVSSSTTNKTATRVAFLPFGVAATESAAQKLSAIQTADGKAIIWEPHATTRANNTAGSVDTTKAFKGAFGAMDKGVTDYASYLEEVTTVKTGDNVTFQLEAGINKIRVYVWIEGQDIDCINTISGGSFNLNLYFKITE